MALFDDTRRPNRAERRALDQLVHTFRRGTDLTEGERTLLWKFRFFLTSDPRALTKFLYSGAEGSTQ